ncbi:MAG: hypothetical protein VW405_17765 [Rhodospirillaceae bacterium]
MEKTELIRLLSDSAREALAKAEGTAPDFVKELLDEAEELMDLAMSLLNKAAAVVETREAA